MNVPAVAVNVALLDPEAIMTDAGTVMVGVFELRPTLTPPEPAMPLRLAVQTLELPGASEFGTHARLLIVNGATTEIEPPVAVIETPAAVEDAPSALATPIVAVPTVADIETETVATDPLRILALFIPVATQL